MNETWLLLSSISHRASKHARAPQQGGAGTGTWPRSGGNSPACGSQRICHRAIDFRVGLEREGPAQVKAQRVKSVRYLVNWHISMWRKGLGHRGDTGVRRGGRDQTTRALYALPGSLVPAPWPERLELEGRTEWASFGVGAVAAGGGELGVAGRGSRRKVTAVVGKVGAGEVQETCEV